MDRMHITSTGKRVLITRDPFIPKTHPNLDWREQGLWEFYWVEHPGSLSTPFVIAYRCVFDVVHEETVRIHVSADERYDLYLDGQRIGRGPERGAPDLWYFESYDLILQPGTHKLVARVYSLGETAPEAQMSVHSGFLCAPEGEWGKKLGTGMADWQVKILSGYEFIQPELAHWKGAKIQIDGSSFSWGFEYGEGDSWMPVKNTTKAAGKRIDWSFRPLHLLSPATLPPMIDRYIQTGNVYQVEKIDSLNTRQIAVSRKNCLPERVRWQNWLTKGESLTISPKTMLRVLIDLENYYTAFPELITSKGAGSLVRIHWAESLFHEPRVGKYDKGNRDEIEGKYFIGMGNTYLPDGGMRRVFDSLWWEAGRFIEIVIQTGDEELILEQLGLWEYRYPIEMESSLDFDDQKMMSTLPILLRGLQMCANETYFDCPYYEEMMYAGDTRLETLITYVISRDDRLPRKALRLFDVSRLATGLTQARYPCRILQIIPSFALWWVGMVWDYAYWRGEKAFLSALMPGLRQTLEGFRNWINSDGLLQGVEGWNTLDWVPTWNLHHAGMPPDAVHGVSGVLNWQLVYILSLAADLEEKLGEICLAERNRSWAKGIAEKAMVLFWDEKRGMLADDVRHEFYSEHSQIFAILSGYLDAEKQARAANALLHEPDLDRATIYFSHYLFEAYRKLGTIDAFFNRLSLWYGLIENGLKTTIESPEPVRSDCHAWGAHPLYHYFATILGIRPGSLGFSSVEIRPQPGHLSWANGVMVHPGGGEISVEFRFEESRLQGEIILPQGITGNLYWNDLIQPLMSGKQIISI